MNITLNDLSVSRVTKTVNVSAQITEGKTEEGAVPAYIGNVNFNVQLGNATDEKALAVEVLSKLTAAIKALA